MANVYWFGGTGNWSDQANHWSNNSNNSPASLHGAAPGTDDNALFDAASFTAGSQVVTVDATAVCLNMDWTGATNSPTLNLAGFNINHSGNVTFIAAMTISVSTAFLSATGAGAITLTTNGATVSCRITTAAAFTGSLTQVGALTTTADLGIYHQSGTYATGNQTIVASGSISFVGAANKTFTPGSSAITCSAWSYTGSNLTVTANTATINVSGTGAFTGGNITTYNRIHLNGTAHTLSGDWICNLLRLKPATIQTITGTTGEIITVRYLDIPSHGKNVITLTGAGAWTIQGNTGYFEGDYLSLTNVVAGWKYLYYAGDNSTDGGGNTNWIFRRVIRPSFPFRIGGIK
jgi:hypothetical protein